MSRQTEHGRGVPGEPIDILFLYLANRVDPGIFFKYDIEPMHLTIRERTVTLLDFLVRLAGIIGGILGSLLSMLRLFLR